MKYCHICKRKLNRYDLEFFFDYAKNKNICQACANMKIREREILELLKNEKLPISEKELVFKLKSDNYDINDTWRLLLTARRFKLTKNMLSINEYKSLW